MRLQATKSLKLGNLVPMVDRGAVFEVPERVAEKLLESGLAVAWQPPEESPALVAVRKAVSEAEGFRKPWPRRQTR